MLWFFYKGERAQHIPVHLLVGLIPFVDGISIDDIPVTVGKHASEVIRACKTKGGIPGFSWSAGTAIPTQHMGRPSHSRKCKTLTKHWRHFQINLMEYWMTSARFLINSPLEMWSFISSSLGLLRETKQEATASQDSRKPKMEDLDVQRASSFKQDDSTKKAAGGNFHHLKIWSQIRLSAKFRKKKVELENSDKFWFSQKTLPRCNMCRILCYHNYISDFNSGFDESFPIGYYALGKLVIMH